MDKKPTTPSLAENIEKEKEIVKTKWPAAISVISICVVGILWIFSFAPVHKTTVTKPVNKIQKAALPPKDSRPFIPLATKSKLQTKKTSVKPTFKKLPLPKPKPIVITGSISKHDSFSKIMTKAKISPNETLKMVKASKKVLNLNTLQINKNYKIELSPNGKFNYFEYYFNNSRYYRLKKRGTAYKAKIIDYKFDTDLKIVKGSIKNSLIADVLEYGGSYQNALELTEVFAWDVNFFKDIRKGDKFKFLVETKSRDGKFVKDGKILAAVLQTRKKTFDAIYFKAPDGSARYYTSEGKPLVKQFLKAPLKYSRISSRYTYRRFHPVYKKYLPHLGVDYAAPIGTPVVALADGIVASAGRNGRAGKYVALTHYGVYRTAYSHLSRFGRGVKKGKKVHQGQIIGYVGTTGASTGPHLDFQLKKFGKPINPLSFKSPGGPPVKKAYREAFMQSSIQKLYVLEETEKATIVAAYNKTPKRKQHAKKIIASSIAKSNQSYN